MNEVQQRLFEEMKSNPNLTKEEIENTGLRNNLTIREVKELRWNLIEYR